MAEACDTCRFFRFRNSDDGHLVELCCRHAPTPSHMAQYPARVPSVRWCGEWRAADRSATTS